MFKFFKHITSKYKILLLAFILILIPGAIISYMSLRSINQKADNLRAKFNGTVILVRDKLESEAFQLEANLRNNVIESFPNTNSSNDLKVWLEKLESENPAFKNLFLINENNGLISSIVSLGWNNETGMKDFLNPPAQNSFNMAEKAEFINIDYNEAVRLYQKALNYVNSDQKRAQLLSRIGRCYFKKRDYSNGINAYKKILELGNDEIKIGEVPATIVALYQIKEGYKALETDEKHFQALQELYQQLLNHPWDLIGGEYLYYLKTISEEILEFEDSDIYLNFNSLNMDNLKIIENKILDQITFLEFLKRNILSEIKSDLKDGSTSDSQLKTISTKENDSTMQLGFFKLPETFQQSQIFAIGYEFESNYILSNLFPRILNSVELGRDVFVGVLGDNDSLLYLHNNRTIPNYLVAENFSRLFVNWKVALYDQDGKSIDQIIGKERRLYLTLFMGIIAVMLIGIVVMVRAVIHESEVSRMKSEFVSNVSHELKTPLTLIRMFGETLDTGMVTDENKRKEFYSIIRKESERLTHLIDNVLDFSKMDTGAKKYHFKESDLVNVVRSSLEAYKFHIRDNGFEIKSVFPEGKIELKIDSDAISQALLNLLSNAVKYSEDKKFIRVEVSSNVSSAIISVTDNGVGIAKGELNKIFDKFYRASTSKVEQTGGSGLGLALVKHIVEAHKGAIDVKSDVGKGSRFTIRIPLNWKAT